MVDLEDSEMTYNVLMGTLNPTHSVTAVTLGLDLGFRGVTADLVEVCGL